MEFEVGYPGMTQYDFVQQVYYQQEKVLLDFWPSDDKYKEVLVEANNVLQELQKEEDWEWLRERVVLLNKDGSIAHTNTHSPTFFWDSAKYYKPCTQFGDAVSLYEYRCDAELPEIGDDEDPQIAFEEWSHGKVFWNRRIDARYMSSGKGTHRQRHQHNSVLYTDPHDITLGALIQANAIKFTRRLAPWEMHRIPMLDMQRLIEKMTLPGTDKPDDIEQEDWDALDDNRKMLENAKRTIVLKQIPDPNYVIVRTAALHAEGSPVASGQIAGLTDRAQKLLSAMRENNAAATSPDFMDWDRPGFLEAI